MPNEKQLDRLCERIVEVVSREFRIPRDLLRFPQPVEPATRIAKPDDALELPTDDHDTVADIDHASRNTFDLEAVKAAKLRGHSTSQAVAADARLRVIRAYCPRNACCASTNASLETECHGCRFEWAGLEPGDSLLLPFKPPTTGE